MVIPSMLIMSEGNGLVEGDAKSLNDAFLDVKPWTVERFIEELYA